MYVNVFTLDGVYLSKRKNLKTLIGFEPRRDDSVVFVSGEEYITRRLDYTDNSFSIIRNNLKSGDEKIVTTKKNWKLYTFIKSKLVARAGRTIFTYTGLGYPPFEFAVNSRGDIVYSDGLKYRVFKDDGKKSHVLIQEDFEPDNYTKEQLEWYEYPTMCVGDEKGNPTEYYLPKPEHPRMISKLIISDNDDIWVSVRAKNLGGYLRYDSKGRKLGHYVFKVGRPYYASPVMKNGHAYFSSYDQEKGICILRAAIPAL